MKLFNKKIGTTILRVVFGIIILKDFINYYLNRKYLFGKEGIVSYQTYEDIVKHYNLEWLRIDFDIESNITIFCIVSIFFSILFTLGVFKKISTLIIFFMLFIFKIRNIYLIDGGDNVISVLLPFLFFVDSYSLIDKYESFSQKIKLKYEKYLNITSVIFSFAIIFQICILYFFAGLHKLSGELWRNGTAIYYILNSQDFSATKLGIYITKSLLIVKFLTWITIIFQLAFPFLIWIEKIKRPLVIFGILFHIGILFLMRIGNFSIIMLACYAIFITDLEYMKLYNRLNLKLSKK